MIIYIYMIMIYNIKCIKIKIAIAHMKTFLLRTGNSVILSDRVNDKRKIEKFSNHILYTQRET